MGSRYELRDETMQSELIDCSGRAAEHFLALMDDAEIPFTLVSGCSFHGHASNPVSEQAVYYSAATVAGELAALTSLLERRPPGERLHGLPVSEWIAWFARARDHANCHRDHQYSAAFFV